MPDAPVRLDELLHALVAGAQRLAGADAGSVALIEGDELVFTVATGPHAARIAGLRIPVGRGIAGYAVSSGQPVALDDVSADPRFARDFAEALGYVPRGIVAVPLETDDEVVGVLELLDPAPGDVTLELLAILTRQAAATIVLARAYTELARGTAPGLTSELAELDRLGPAEREAARAMLRAFLDYATGR